MDKINKIEKKIKLIKLMNLIKLMKLMKLIRYIYFPCFHKHPSIHSPSHQPAEKLIENLNQGECTGGGYSFKSPPTHLYK